MEFVPNGKRVNEGEQVSGKVSQVRESKGSVCKGAQVSLRHS